jgi:phosphoribosylformylglycinamidine synthase
LNRNVQRVSVKPPVLQFDSGDLASHLSRVLRFPAVGSKSFLVTIGDRTVGGLTVRDQMVGPWQIPVADAAVTLGGFQSHTGEAMAMGERSPLAVIDGPASGRMAIAEAVTNIASAPIEMISDIRLSANWMAAAGEAGQEAVLFDTVKAVGMELCPELGIAIPVGKDSLSMKTLWNHEGDERRMLAPVSLIISAFAPVADVRRCLTPQLKLDSGATRLLLIDLGGGRNRLGGSALAQVNNQFGDQVPDLDEPALLRGLFSAVQILNCEGRLLAYHDRSDGGVIITLLEMAFAAHCGLDLELPEPESGWPAFLFCEEAGAVIQVAERELESVFSVLAASGLVDNVHDLGAPSEAPRLRLFANAGDEHPVLDLGLPELQKDWMETSHAVQSLRDNPETADSELVAALDWQHPGMAPKLSFDPCESPAAPMINQGARPTIAILREQGVNGQIEMAAAFDLAGFRAVDVHMSDLQQGRRTLSEFAGFVACGGFSYGDVLGAGQGWAKSILYSNSLRELFGDFLADTGKFALGVCNGCQMLAALRELVPGTDNWPDFLRNHSEQFEARLSLVEISGSPSLFFGGMEGSRLPIAVAHGEGRASFGGADQASDLVCMRYVESSGRATDDYPANPNGSPGGVTGLCNLDGRVTILMPHPERTLRRINFSWAPADWPDVSPWRRMFENARQWVA